MLSLKELRQWLENLLQLTDQMTQGAPYWEEDHLAFMTFCFFNKQIDHARSILRLMPSRDSMLIARSMIEGLAQLLWAAKEPDVLPLKWRTYAWVHDWRRMKEKVAAGEVIDKNQRAQIEEAIRKYGEQYFTREARRARSERAPIPDDPYHSSWTSGQQIRQICEKVGGEALNKKVYVPFSDWHHWGAGGLGQAIARRGNQVTYSSLSEQDSASALTTAFQCLLQTAEVADSQFRMGLGAKLAELKDGYIAAHLAAQKTT